MKNATELARLFSAGVSNGRYKAYGAGDIRLSQEISADSVAAVMLKAAAGGKGGAAFEKFLIKQDWMYLHSGILVARITGIAPVVEKIAADGNGTEEPHFWLYYPATCPYLREQKVTGGALPALRNLDEVFEVGTFSSPILSSRQSEPASWFKTLRLDVSARMLQWKLGSGQ